MSIQRQKESESGQTQDAEVSAFRSLVARLATEQFAPSHGAWESEGRLPQSAWKLAGSHGLLCSDLEETWGGAGGDFRHAVAVIETLAGMGLSGPCYSFMVHSDIVAPYLSHYAPISQKKRWLPRLASGEAIGAIAMTEPGTGSDLKAIRTRARESGDGFVITGAKTFITNASVADLFIVVARTDSGSGSKGISLFLVDAAAPGVRRGRPLEKLGMKAANTAEVFFDDVYVPADALLGEDGAGFGYLMQQLPRERLVIAIAALAAAEGVLDITASYVRQRHAFGQPLISFQNTRFKLAELKTELVVARSFINGCIAQQMLGSLDTKTAAIAKLHMTELQGRVVDTCVQLHGGYGYMWEYPVTRAYADARVMRIFGGTNEMMKDLIARSFDD